MSLRDESGQKPIGETITCKTGGFCSFHVLCAGPRTTGAPVTRLMRKSALQTRFLRFSYCIFTASLYSE
jgi:hypothetical protein